MNAPTWQLYFNVVVYLVGAILSWFSPTIRKDVVVPTMIWSSVAQITLCFLSSLAILIYRAL